MPKLVSANVKDLPLVAIDWLVAQIEGIPVTYTDKAVQHIPGQFVDSAYFCPTEDIQAAYEIINREKLQTRYVDEPGHSLHGLWLAMDCRFRSASSEVGWTPFGRSYAPLCKGYMTGKTIMEAAMRFHVANNLGLVVEIPRDIIKKRSAKK